MSNSISPALLRKPRPDFPLYPHGKSKPKTARWAKKVRGQRFYFGKVLNDPDGKVALNLWLEQKDDLFAGRIPRPKGDGLTIQDLCNRFLTAKDGQLAAGELSPITRRDYQRTTDRIIGHFGKTRRVDDLDSEDFESLKANIARTRGIVGIGNEVQRVRVVFKFAYDAGLIEKPVRYGPMFKRPSRKSLRVARAKQPTKVFHSAEIRELLKRATPQMKAMILMGVNAGFGNSDCATLPLRALDLKGGWVNYPRAKTGIPRRAPLWPETVTAIKTAVKTRRQPKDQVHEQLVFITAARGSFAKDTTDSPIAKEFAKLVKTLELAQAGRGFYSLRHTFRTAAGAARDLEATRSIMGHVNEHVEETYIHKIEDKRLRRVVNTVRKWLFGNKRKRA